MKHLPDDFREFLASLNDHKVEYLVVGGWALGVHGYVRATGHMDVWVGQKSLNLDRLLQALSHFGVPGPISKDFFEILGNTFRMGRPPMKIEVITEASGIDFYESFSNRVNIEAEGIQIPFIGYNDLVTNKRSTGRLKDMADLEALGESLDPPK